MCETVGTVRLNDQIAFRTRKAAYDEKNREFRTVLNVWGVIAVGETTPCNGRDPRLGPVDWGGEGTAVSN